MKPANFETYKPKQGEFAIAQSRTGNNFKPYVPTLHPFAERLSEHRNISSLWTPNKPAEGK